MIQKVELQREIFWISMLMHVSWPTVKKLYQWIFFVQCIYALFILFSVFLYKIQNSLNCKISVDSRNDAIRIPETKSWHIRGTKKCGYIFLN